MARSSEAVGPPIAQRPRESSTRRRRATSSSPTEVAASDLAAMLHRARVKAFLGRLPDAAPEEGVCPDPALAALIEHTAAMYAQAITDSTRSAYARRWRLSAEWCAIQELSSLPAAPETVMLYLTTTAGTKAYSLPTIRGWVAAINRVHIEAGVTAPGIDPGVTLLMRGLSRSRRDRRPPPPMSALRSLKSARCVSFSTATPDVPSTYGTGRYWRCTELGSGTAKSRAFDSRTLRSGQPAHSSPSRPPSEPHPVK